MKKNSGKWISGLLCLLLITGNLAFANPQIAYGVVETDASAHGNKVAKEDSLSDDVQDLEGEEQIPESDPLDGGEQQVTDIPGDSEVVEEPEETPEAITDEPTITPAGDVTAVAEITDEPTEEQVDQPDVDAETGQDGLEGRRLVTHEALDLDLDDISTGVRASASDLKYNANQAGLVTVPKDQGYYGTCWAFTATSLAETSLIKNSTLVNGTISNKSNTDLSELHAAYFFANKSVDPLGNTAGDKVTIADNDYKDAGGNLYLQAFSYANGVGAVPESVLEYGNIASLNPGNSKVSGLAYQHPAAMKNAYFINNTKNQIKAAVLKYGSVGMSYYHDLNNTYYNSATGAYCYPKNTTSVNHAVTIVGWDDQYSWSNFKSVSKVTENGAWIVKNSWGTGWGKSGYIYISYQDGSINDTIAMEFQDGAKYDYNYQYDGTPGPMAAMVGNGGKIANVYQVKGSGKNGNEILKAVSFALNSTQIDYSIQVYVDIQNRNKPTSGTAALKTPVTGKTSYAGIYTVDLGTDINLSRGTYYSIVITLKGKSTIEHFVEASYNLGWVSGQVKTAAKQSFASWDGNGWEDLNNGKISARIKGFTVEDPDKPLSSTIQKVASGGYNSNKLAWTKTEGAAGYEIYRSTSSSSGFEKVATVTNGATVSYTDKSLAFNKTYYYKIRSYKNSSGGQVTVKVKGYYSKILGSKTALAKSTVSKVASAGYNKIKVTWSKVSGAHGYQLVRSTSKTGKYTTVAKITSGSTVTYTDKGRTTGKKYYYKVRPYRKVGKTNVNGSYSAVLDGKANLSKSGITALNNKTAAKMKLTWKQVSGASGYEVYRKTGTSGTYKKVKTIKGGSSLTFTNEKLQSGTYYYKVRAYRTISGKKVYGAFSAEKYAKLKEIPAKTLKLNKTSEKVTLMPTAIILSESTVEMAQGTTYDLSAVFSTYEKKQIQLTATVTPANTTMKTVSWTSSNKVAANVSSKGLVTLAEPGTVTITAKTINGLTKTFKLTINASSITWTSKDPGIATVSQGKVTAAAPGTTVITAQASNGVSMDCAVTVTP